MATRDARLGSLGGFALIVGAGWFLGCGESAGSNDGGTSTVSGATGGTLAGVGGGAGTAGSGGASSGGAGSGGGAAMGGGAGSAGVSGGSACIEYVKAACHRIRECRGVDNDPLSDQICGRADACPDNFFSEGSLRTPEGVFACAESWRTFPCNLLNLGAVPSCTSPGTRAPGETCTFSSQCSSGSCTAGSGTCGTCSTPVARGGVCDGLATVCEPGLVCVGASGGDTTGVCGDPPAPGGVGTPCVNNGYCADGFACAQNTQTCQMPSHIPGAGETCSATAGCATFTYCDETNTCRDNPRLGEPCTEMLSPGIYRGACFDSRCNDTGSPPTCVERPGPGDPCIIPITRGAQLEGGCRDGSLCDCDVPDCSVGDTGVCHAVALEGEPCTDPLTRCNPAFECMSGVCRPRASQGIFERLCGP